jgi:glutamate transport system permease protein
MSAPATAKNRTIRDALYEEPGPHTRRRVRIGTAISLVLVAAALYVIGRRFYVTGQFAPKYWKFFLKWSTWRFLLQGFEGTVKVALTAGVISLVLGLLLMLGRISSIRPLSAVCRVIINFFRGVPSLLLIYFFFLVVPQYGIKMSAFWMLTLPVALAAAGVLAEVFRAGVNAVPKGQVEAALSLGMSPLRTTLKIVLPQAVRFVIPSLISQLVVVVKDTTVAYVVSYPDLMQNARVLITNYDALVSVYFSIAVIYILINYAINQASVYVSRRTGAAIIR